jgi:uncharacterized YccA/Bax inhibitor family protein
MDIYADLFESMLACCIRLGIRRGPLYTAAMMLVSLGLSLNILSVIDLLWMLGILSNPYQSAGTMHYIYALLCIAFVANTILARRQFSGTRASSHAATQVRAAAPAYLVASMALFVTSLMIGLQHIS